MTERLVVRVTLHGESEYAAARTNRISPSQSGRPRKGSSKGLWMIGGAVAAGLSLVLAASLLMDFSSERSIQGDVAQSEAQRSKGGPVESREAPKLETAAFKTEPASRPEIKRKAVSKLEAVSPTPAAVDDDAEMPVPPAVAPGKPVAKPKSAVQKDEAAPKPAKAAEAPPAEPKVSEVAPAKPRVADAPPAKPKVAAAVAPSTRSGQRAATDKPKPAVAPTITDSRVLRAQLTAGISGKEPIARLQPPIRLNGDSDRTIYYFSEVKNLDGQTVFHRWERDGRVLATIPFEIGGPRWRVYSRKTITPKMTGKWRVVLADSSGKELANSAFHVR